MRSRPIPRAHRSIPAIVAAALALLILPTATLSAQPRPSGTVKEISALSDTAAARAMCGEGSDPGAGPETGLQGDVPAADRDNRRSAAGYSCNMRMLGNYPGQGGGINSITFEHCAYIGTTFPGNLMSEAQGVQVLDVSDPTAPVRTAVLNEPAMRAGTWESLKVNHNRKLLAGTGVPFMTGAGLLSVYDISDCAHPRLLNPGPGTNPLIPLPITGHEGGFSPDGNTYWSSGTAPGLVSAVDLTDPSNPRVVWQGLPGLSMHGMGFSPDGTTLYLADNIGGMVVMDVSAVQRRDPNPQVHQRSHTTWTDGWATQHNIPVTYRGVPYVFSVNEAGSGGVKILDVTDPAHPRLANTIKLEINLPDNQDVLLASSGGGSLFSYDAHYCAADRPVDPTALACGWTSSGIRVFDVEDPTAIREIAYYNPPARADRRELLTNSSHAIAAIIGLPVLAAPTVLQTMVEGRFDLDQALSNRTGMLTADLTTDWCFSPPEWRGNQLWTTCSDNGFLTLELSPAVYTPPADQHSHIGA